MFHVKHRIIESNTDFFPPFVTSLRVAFTCRDNQGLLSQLSIKILLFWSVELAERSTASSTLQNKSSRPKVASLHSKNVRKRVADPRPNSYGARPAEAPVI